MDATAEVVAIDSQRPLCGTRKRLHRAGYGFAFSRCSLLELLRGLAVSLLSPISSSCIQ
jgi:hypothetical protein